MENISHLKNWYEKGIRSEFIEDNWCRTRADFNARLASYYNQLVKRFNEECIFLVLSSIGEVGNNCFDHNLGYWQDEPGCLFIREDQFSLIVDRGQGIKSSIQKVVSKMANSSSIEFVYSHIISGRAPEKRGNGLKFVKKNVFQCGISLYVQTQKERFSLNADKNFNDIINNIESIDNSGVLTLFYW